MLKNKPLKHLFSIILTFLIILGSAVFCKAPDEGMWTFDNPPTKKLQERYGFAPTQEWLDHVRLSSVRFMDGGSGAFISPNGLVMTNHHVGLGQIQKLSTPKNNMVETGFYAKTQEEELKCPDLELNVLTSMENVTKRVRDAAKEGMDEEEAMKARNAEIAHIEKESLEETGLRSDVINLYHGGEYWLYRYKKYTDVRLVFAPERQAAHFGGDLDNFTYPRYCLDVAFFRVYENDKPLQKQHYFAWNSEGASDGELVFVPGNPGSTDRLYPYAYLEYQRDYRYPNLVNYIDERLSWLGEYAEKGKEQRQQAMIQIYRYQNAKKAYNGQFKGLQNEEIMEARKKGEMEFREKVRSNPELNKAYGDAWTRIEKLLAAHATRMDNHFYRQLRGSKLAYTALRIVRYVSEIKKPDSERMDGYHDAKLEGLKFKLLSPAPFYPELENVTFAGWLSLAKKNLGEDDPFIKLVLDGQTPEQVARQVIDDSKLTEVEYRKSLLEGGEEAVKSADDPLLKFVQRVDPFLREEAEWYKNTVKSVFADAETKIAKARFAVYGKSIYPDATFTLRLSYGAAKGYPMNGTRAPYKTSLYGLYDRTLSFDREGEFTLPERFWTHKEKLDLSTPVNLVSTNDVIGGNSGSPLINKAAEIVGIVFDGNIESLVGRFVYDDKTNRTVSVHSAYIIEALRKLYGARALADEIEVSQVKASRE